MRAQELPLVALNLRKIRTNPAQDQDQDVSQKSPRGLLLLYETGQKVVIVYEPERVREGLRSDCSGRSRVALDAEDLLAEPSGVGEPKENS